MDVFSTVTASGNIPPWRNRGKVCFVVTAWTNLNWRDPSLNVRQWQSSSKSRQNRSPQTPAKRVSVCQTIRRHSTNERVARGATRVSAKPYHRDVGNGSPCLCYPPNVCTGICPPSPPPPLTSRSPRLTAVWPNAGRWQLGLSRWASYRPTAGLRHRS